MPDIQIRSSSDLRRHIADVVGGEGGDLDLVALLTSSLLEREYDEWLEHWHKIRPGDIPLSMLQWFREEIPEARILSVRNEAVKILFSFVDDAINERLPDIYKESFSSSMDLVSKKLDKNARLTPAFLLGTLTGIVGNALFAVLNNNYGDAIAWMRNLMGLHNF